MAPKRRLSSPPRALPKIVITDRFHPELLRTLQGAARIQLARTRRALEREIRSADALITSFRDPVDEALIQHAPRLKVVGNVAVGIDNIDLPACARRGIRVVNTPDVLTRATAELSLTLLLAAARHVPQGHLLCRSGRFKGWAPDMLLGLELQGRTAVIVGPGRIGSETARLYRGIGLKTQFIMRDTPASKIRDRLKKAQVLSLHFPLHAGTRHWLNAERLALLPADAIVINTSRGPTIDEAALTRALKDRRIFAAGLDVYEREPRIPAALRRLPNVVLLPHLGSATEVARAQMARLAASGVLAILIGKNPPNEVKSRTGWLKTQDSASSLFRTAPAKPPRR